MSAQRRNIMLGTAGHVDHGKSALVKLLTGCETDTLAEEKQRGLTIDLGFAPCRLADQRILGIVDMPGHVDFIRNMVAGAHGIDIAIFVVAADDGIMPQTHEHLHILTLMGLRHGLVALTKIDLVDAARREFVIHELRRLLAGTFLVNAPICPISNVTGEGLDHFLDVLNQTAAACEDRSCEGIFRLWVEDAFTIRGAGTVVTGIPTHGRIRSGDELHLLPGEWSGSVRRMQVYGEDATEARAGECVALNLPKLDAQFVRRGMVLSESTQLELVTMAEAEFRVLNSVEAQIDDYAELQIHVGTAAASARLAMLERKEISGGQRQFVQLRFSAPLPLIPGERFVARANISTGGIAGWTTIGGGQILGLSNARLRRNRRWTLDLLAARERAIQSPQLWVEQMVRESDSPIPVATLQKKCANRPAEISAMLERLQAEGRVISAAGGWIHQDTIRKIAEKILPVVREFHRANPQRAGVRPEELRAILQVDSAALDLAAESLIQSRQLKRDGALLAASDWTPMLPDRDQQLCDQLAARWREAGWAPPILEELAVTLNQPAQRLMAMARLLTERGVLVRLDDRIWMHRDAVERARQEALKLFERAASYSTMDFRDALGVSRKFAVPLADYLDRMHFTVRSGNLRTPGVEAKKLIHSESRPQFQLSQHLKK